jgi:hypothetical protein
MSREEASAILEEILTTSRTLVEMGDAEHEATSFCQALRQRRRTLLARLRDVRSEEGRQ